MPDFAELTRLARLAWPEDSPQISEEGRFFYATGNDVILLCAPMPGFEGALRVLAGEPRVEARYDERGALDEVVTGAVEMFHLEYMDKGRVWMALYWGLDRRVVINLTVRGRGIHAAVESDAEIAVPIKRVRP